MTILEMKPVSIAEAKEIAESIDEEDQLIKFIKKFAKISKEDVKKMEGELEKLEIMKLKEENIAKIIDLMPEDAADMNKIFSDINLDENEITKILEVVKKYR